ncbi:MAG: ferredoxin [Parcubacteria group bacterium]|jgi:ferredoxin|nr:ferredoxin [Parcubacteria group bacterium]|tara:strand:+ start:3319 stop:3510 length:192 start_codon:yes stop_codon:yes gene_type:complete
MKIKIDQEACIGCGSCQAICPDFFEMNEENKAEVKKTDSGANDDCVQEAVEICPVDVIKVDKS